MIRYRTPIISSYNLKKLALKHIPRLGRIHTITGKRYTSRLFGVTTNRECVIVRGDNGTARFFGVCWSYFGTGPHSLIDLLLLCGCSRDLCEHIAFRSPRNDADGTDWHYNVIAGKLDTYEKVVTKRENFLPPNYIALKLTA